MATYKNADEWAAATLEKLRKSIDVKNYYELTNEIISRQSKRVFDKGTPGEGTAYNYSRKPIYASNLPKYTPRKNPPRGKNSNSPTFANGNKRKSTYFPGGYGQFKQAVGKGSGGKVNLWLFGNFRRMFQNAGKNPLARNTQTGVSIFVQLIASSNNPSGKIDGILERYPNMFKLTKGERGFIVKRFREILLENINK